MHSFWTALERPFFVLAPMADVTDPAYRAVISSYGNPDVMWTEFVSADGLYHTREMKGMKDDENPLLRDLLFGKGEHPIVAQIFSSKPEMIRYASKLAAELGFDGVDINMGCPDKAIERQGCGAGMIKRPELVPAIVAAAREGAKDAGRPDMGVSVKTRIGYNTEEIDTWIRAVLTTKPDALTVHLRTRKEMSKVPAHWELMPTVVALRDEVSPETRILGNGDVVDLADAKQKATESGVDGIMLGRAIFGTPWLFTGKTDATPAERLLALSALAEEFSKMRPAKSFHLLKKHVKAFVTGYGGAADLRTKLMDAKDVEELQAHIKEALKAL